MKYETKSLVVREPVGVVAALCAFNFPLPGIAQKTAPAIVAGCTAVVKVPDPDPLAIFAMADLVTEAGLPARRDQHRRGGARGVGAPGQPPRRRHGHVHRLHRGRQEDRRGLRRAGQACVLELGGKSAAIILDDADLDDRRSRRSSRVSAGTSQGESCVCMSRILAPRSQYDEIAARLTEAFKSPEGRRPARGRHGRRPADHRGAPRARARLHRDRPSRRAPRSPPAARCPSTSTRAGTSSRRC